MKKIGILSFLLLFLTFGCGKTDVNKVKSDFEETVNKSTSYVLSGTMEIMNNEDTFYFTGSAVMWLNNKPTLIKPQIPTKL